MTDLISNRPSQADRVTATLFGWVLGAVVFAFVFPVLVLAATTPGIHSWQDFHSGWSFAVVLMVGVVDLFIVLILGLPTLALLHRRWRPGWLTAWGAGAVVISALSVLYLALIPDSSFHGDAFLFWQAAGAVSSSLFWGIRQACLRWMPPVA